MRELNLSGDYTKEFSLLGKDKKKVKLRVMQEPSLFNKNFQVV